MGLTDELHKNIGQLISDCGGYEVFKSIILIENSKNPTEIKYQQNRIAYLSIKRQPFYKKVYFRPRPVNKKSIFRPCELLLIGVSGKEHTKELAKLMPGRTFTCIQRVRSSLKCGHYKWIKMLF